MTSIIFSYTFTTELASYNNLNVILTNTVGFVTFLYQHYYIAIK